MMILIRLLLNLIAMCVRTFKNMPGRWRLVLWLQPYLGKAFAGGAYPAEIEINCGYRMIIDKQDHVGRHIFLTGDYEPETTNVFVKILKDGDIVLDIGANIGYFSLLARHCVGKDGHIYSFEASPAICKMLIRNIGINSIDNVSVYNNAVIDSERNVDFYVANDSHLGISSIRSINDASYKQVIKGISIDSLLDKVCNIKLIKIDIEGAEYHALKGMIKVIQRDRPYIVFELTDMYLRDAGSSANDVMQLLYDNNYICYQITWEGLKPIAKNYPEQCNVLAVPDKTYNVDLGLHFED